MGKRPLRIISNSRLWEKLTTGVLKSAMEYASDPKNNLDIQIRDNYLNVYYKGGSILKIKERSIDFDAFYFYTDKSIRKSHLQKRAKANDANAIKIIEALKKSKEAQLDILRKEGDAVKFFETGKVIMDKWLSYLETELDIHHHEKEEQQNISMKNHCGDSDYTVLDLEYEVSTESPFRYDGRLDKVRPRFDIIAINNKSHRLVVIELKKGMGATGGDSGIGPHIDCYEHTIGRDVDKLFLEEMKNLCEQKKTLGYISKQQYISDKVPEFVFAFADKPGEDKYDLFVNSCRNQSFTGKIIYLDKDCKLIQK